MPRIPIPLPSPKKKKPKKQPSLLDRIVKKEIGKLNAATAKRTAEKNAAATRARQDRGGGLRSADAIERRVNQNNPLRNAVYATQGKPPYKDKLRQPVVAPHSKAKPGRKIRIEAPPATKKVQARAISTGSSAPRQQKPQNPPKQYRPPVGNNLPSQPVVRPPRKGNKPPRKGGGNKPGRTAPAPSNPGTATPGDVPATSTTPTTTDTTLQQRAEATVAAELNPQIAEIKRQLDENKITGQQALENIARMYSLATTATEESRAAAESGYKAGGESIRDLNASTLAGIQSNFDTAQAEAAANQERLGITGDNSRTERDEKFLTGLSQITGTNAETSLKGRGIDSDTMFRRLAAGISADSAQRQTEVANDMNRLGRELSAQAGILESTRASKVLALLGELQDKQASTQAEAQQQAFLNEIAARKLGISEKQLAANIAKTRAEIKIDKAKIKLTRRKNESDAAYKARMARIAAQNASTKAMEAAVKAENAKTDRDLKRAQAMDEIASAAARGNKPAQGFDAAREYVNQQIANTPNLPNATQVRNDIMAILTIYPPSAAKKYEVAARGPRTLWEAIRKSDQYRRLPNPAKGLVVSAYQRAYGLKS